MTVHIQTDQLLTQLLIEQLDDSYESLNILSYTCAMTVHIQTDQLLTQLSIEQLDTLPSQYRHIGHLNEVV